jgi:hypothetical protein
VETFRANLGRESRAGRALDAMDRPQDLHNPVQINHFAGLPARMIGGEAPVTGGMPILGGQDQRETIH